MIVAIDGPAAAGKGTLARRLAAHLGVPHLDTGLLYRAVGRIVLEGGGDPADPVAAGAVARELSPAALARGDLRGSEADAAAALVAAIPEVRAALLAFQRAFGHQKGGAVLDGRDIGTVVLPEADVKFWVTADVATRGRRRWLEMRDKGMQAELQTVIDEVNARDLRDAARLIPAADAIWIDTTSLDADMTLANAIARLSERAASPR